MGWRPEELCGILITHEHSDHIAALTIAKPFSERYGVPVYATTRTWRVMQNWCGPMSPEFKQEIVRGTAFGAGSFEIVPFGKSHDAVEPLGFLVRADGQSLVVLTDVGRIEAPHLSDLANADYYVFESNHDYDMEIHSGRPAALISRVLGPRGHLSNEQAADALAKLAGDNTRVVLLAHLSLDCNHPGLARETVSAALAVCGSRARVLVAAAGKPGEMLGGRTSSPMGLQQMILPVDGEETANEG
jgi:phosphoribosyl 1,2-cyclic phosphodiesterase